MKAFVNKREFNITEKSDSPLSFDVNGKEVIIDAISPAKNTMHLLYNSRSYNVELIEYRQDEKIAVVKVNNSTYEIKLKDETDDLLEKLGIGQKINKIAQVKAPMPGKVLEILVKEGDTVNKGDSLIVLEAMKMENIIKAVGTAVVKKVHATKGNAVEKNQVLIEME
jgi:biotin carboxyl carrier protein